MSVAGGKLKEIGTTHWLSPNTGATNISGFTAIASDNRLVNGSYEFPLGTRYAHWWTATESDANMAWNTYVDWSNIYSSRYTGQKQFGFSIRCVKD